MQVIPNRLSLFSFPLIFFFLIQIINFSSHFLGPWQWRHPWDGVGPLCHFLYMLDPEKHCQTLLLDEKTRRDDWGAGKQPWKQWLCRHNLFRIPWGWAGSLLWARVQKGKENFWISTICCFKNITCPFFVILHPPSSSNLSQFTTFSAGFYISES